MTDQEFVRQFAIRMPNGELWHRPGSGMFEGMFGLPNAPRRAAIWDTPAEAAEALQGIRDKAAQMGISEWFGVVVQRLCTPFTQGDPTEHFADEVTQWMQQQGGAE